VSLPLSVAAPAAAEQTQGGSNYMVWGLLVVFAVFMYFMSRRNKKRTVDANAFRTELAPGQRVMTLSGMIGVISRVEGDVITIMSASGDESAWVRRSIRSLVPDEEWAAMTEEYPEDPDEDAAEDSATDEPADAGESADGDEGESSER
jgi:preprotein translocase subunit YajC